LQRGRGDQAPYEERGTKHEKDTTTSRGVISVRKEKKPEKGIPQERKMEEEPSPSISLPRKNHGERKESGTHGRKNEYGPGRVQFVTLSHRSPPLPSQLRSFLLISLKERRDGEGNSLGVGVEKAE